MATSPSKSHVPCTYAVAFQIDEAAYAGLCQLDLPPGQQEVVAQHYAAFPNIRRYRYCQDDRRSLQRVVLEDGICLDAQHRMALVAEQEVILSPGFWSMS